MREYGSEDNDRHILIIYCDPYHYSRRISRHAVIPRPPDARSGCSSIAISLMGYPWDTFENPMEYPMDGKNGVFSENFYFLCILMQEY